MMKDKIEILARLLKEDVITMDEFITLLPEKKESKLGNFFTTGYSKSEP